MSRFDSPSAAANARVPHRLNELALSPRARGIAEGLLRTAADAWHESLDKCLGAAEEALFSHANVARHNHEQTLFLDARRQLHGARALAQGILASTTEAELAQFFVGIEPDASQQPVQSGPPSSRHLSLSLLAVEEHDERVAFERLGARAEARHRTQLVPLSLRLAALASRKPAPLDRLPFAPQGICRALRQALKNPPEQAREVVLDVIDTEWLAHLEAFYSRLEKQLIAAGVLPHLVRAVSLSHGAAGVVHEPRGTTAAERAPAEPPPGQPAAPATPPPAAPAGAAGREQSPNETPFEMLRQALAARRDQRIASSGPAVASPEDLAAVLNALQMGPAGGTQPGDAVARQPFPERLAAALARAGANGTPMRLSEQHADSAELVNVLFRSMSQEMPNSAHAQSTLQKLELPMFRLLVNNPEALSRPDRPARRLLSTLLEISAYWQDVDTESRALLEQAQATIERVETDPATDETLIEDVENDLGRRLRALTRKAELAERRHVEAAAGRARLELARRKAEGAVHSTVGRTNPSLLAKSLLENAWTDVLALTLLRHGEQSDAYKRRLQLAEFLAAPERVQPQESEPVKTEVETGLTQVGFLPDEIQSLVGHVFNPSCESANDPPEDLVRTAASMRSRFAEQRQSDRGAGTLDGALDGNFGPLGEPEQAALKTLRETPPGTWFRFRHGHHGEFVDRKLAWINHDLDRCLFVNRRGAKIDDRSLESLARELARGSVTIVGPRPESVFERVWGRFTGALGLGPKTEQSPT